MSGLFHGQKNVHLESVPGHREHRSDKVKTGEEAEFPSGNEHSEPVFIAV